MVTRLATLPIPTIAAVNGVAAGAGMNLALACDMRVASDRASFGATFVKIGLHPDWGGTYFLTRLVGVARAKELCWLGDVVNADEALRIGLVQRVVGHDRLLDEAGRSRGGWPRRPRRACGWRSARSGARSIARFPSASTPRRRRRPRAGRAPTRARASRPSSKREPAFAKTAAETGAERAIAWRFE